MLYCFCLPCSPDVLLLPAAAPDPCLCNAKTTKKKARIRWTFPSTVHFLQTEIRQTFITTATHSPVIVTKGAEHTPLFCALLLIKSCPHDCSDIYWGLSCHLICSHALKKPPFLSIIASGVPLLWPNELGRGDPAGWWPCDSKKALKTRYSTTTRSETEPEVTLFTTSWHCDKTEVRDTLTGSDDDLVLTGFMLYCACSAEWQKWRSCQMHHHMCFHKHVKLSCFFPEYIKGLLNNVLQQAPQNGAGLSEAMQKILYPGHQTFLASCATEQLSLEWNTLARVHPWIIL